MKKIVLALFASLLVCFTSNCCYANSFLSNSCGLYSFKQSDYQYVKTVNVYKPVNGGYKLDGKCEIYKNAKGYLYLKSNNKMYPVFNTSYPHSHYYKSYAVDEWGYKVFFTV